MRVRVWMVLAAAVGLVTVYFSATRLNEAISDRWLILNGVDVMAKFTRVAGDPVPKRRMRTELMAADFTFTLNGKAYNISTPALEPKHDAYAMVGTDFHIRVDPNNPERWTEETQPKPWSQELTVVGFLVPLWLVVTAIMLWMRQGVLATWRDAPLVEGVVAEIRHSPIAPLSRIVRFSLRDSSDRRIWSTLMPASTGLPAVGQTLWLLCTPTKPGRAIVARLYS